MPEVEDCFSAAPQHQRTTTHFARKVALKDEAAGRIGQVRFNKACEARAVGQV